MELGVSGLASGFDWRAIADKLADVERAPQRRLRSEQSLLDQRRNAFNAISSQLTSLKARIEALSQGLFGSRLAASSDNSILATTVSNGAASGNHTFNFIQLASSARIEGTPKISAGLSQSDDVSGLAFGNAGFWTPIQAGVFTVNGKQVSVSATDTLQEVFDKITAATDGAVTASYSAASDRILLSGSSEIVLGSATDTSNFLQAARLNNNGTDQVASSASLGGVRTTAALNLANFASAITNGGSNSGEFKINGVSIAFDAGVDTLGQIIQRINNSAAGVLASYDATLDRMVITNKSTGDVGIALEDIEGNFLAATGISSGALQRGKDLVYTVNGGGQRVSRQNVVSEVSSGIAGLSVTASKEGVASVTITTDTAKIKKAITDLVEEYNKAQALIDSRTASSTNASGKVTLGVLAGDTDANAISGRLRSLANIRVEGAIRGLADLGIISNGYDNSLRIENEEKLASAIENSLEAVAALFTQPETGVAARFSSYLERTVGDSGTLPNKQGNIEKQSAAIETQIAGLERQVQANRERMIAGFLAMEQAQAQMNQQLQFLQMRFSQMTKTS
jgi:flagellar hook-associated protein 2